MASFNEILQNYVNKSYEELLFFAHQSFAEVAPDLTRFFKDDDGAAKALMVIIAACLGADGKLTALESKFLNELLNQEDDYESTVNMVAALGDDESRDLTDQLADALPADKKAALVSFCLCFLAVDETITRDEVAFVVKLMES
ncbi:MAG: hypothetical protein E7605_08885 [Ruminococcaceae bacterium]|nr:hypothetical protein [Oscillospiraceae bacterium]